MTLCDYCKHANMTCEIYPMETSSCVEFKPESTEALKRGALIIASGMRNAATEELSMQHWRLLCRLLLPEDRNA